MSDPTAVIPRRIGAYLLDSLIVTLVVTIVFLQVGTTGPAAASCSDVTAGAPVQLCVAVDDAPFYATGNAAATVFGFALLVTVLNFVVLQGLTGASLGKRTCRLRVVREDGSNVGIARAALRWVGLFVDSQPAGIPLVGLITAMISPGHRRVGDMAAKTYVVDQQYAGSPIAIASKPAGSVFTRGSAQPPPPAAGDQPPPNGGGWQPPTAER